ncbi:MAG: hypothetical protein KJ069_23210 [Anaerolineae bacterium]|nr:hypothetical protein [Anaerolineae bacterium]
MTTKCVNPQEIREGDLLAYMAGAARQEVGKHIAQCPYCAVEVAALRLLEVDFQVALERAYCPETDVLLQYHMRMLPAAERQQVQNHVLNCPDCQVELRHFLPQPTPLSWIEQLQRAGRTLVEAIQLPPPMQPAFVMRGSAQEESYQAGNYQIVLAKEPPIAAENRWGLEGQVIHNENPTAIILQGRVSLRQTDTLIAQDEVDSFGYFGLANIAAGIYTLHIELQVDDIIVNNVTIP